MNARQLAATAASILIGSITSFAISAAAPAKLPAQGPTWCVNHDFIADSTWTGGYDLAVEGPVDALNWSDARKRYLTELQYVGSCSPGPSRDLFEAYLTADRAVIRHHDGRDVRDDLNLARQLFGKCAARYYAKPQGAKCETMSQTMTGLLIKWAPGT
jgi:hypothetical protein